MLTRYELLIWFFGAWYASAVAYAVIKKTRGTRLPAGAIEANRPPTDLENHLPGTSWSRVGVIAGMGVNSFLTVALLFLCAFDLWNSAIPYIAVDLPTPINWAGIAGVWMTDMWAVAVMYYNVNYIPANRPMREQSALIGSGFSRYVLATGGPYKWIRHPMYVSKILLGLFIFLATGIWLTVFTCLAVVSLPAQARGEEKMLHDLFGETFDNYAARTGRFLPRTRGA